MSFTCFIIRTCRKTVSIKRKASTWKQRFSYVGWSSCERHAGWWDENIATRSWWMEPCYEEGGVIEKIKSYVYAAAIQKNDSLKYANVTCVHCFCKIASHIACTLFLNAWVSCMIDSFTRGGTHIFGRTVICRSNGSLFYKKSLNMGPVFYQKILKHGSTVLTEPKFLGFRMTKTPKIAKFLKKGPIFQEKSLKMGALFCQNHP